MIFFHIPTTSWIESNSLLQRNSYQFGQKGCGEVKGAKSK